MSGREVISQIGTEEDNMEDRTGQGAGEQHGGDAAPDLVKELERT